MAFGSVYPAVPAIYESCGAYCPVSNVDANCPISVPDCHLIQAKYAQPAQTGMEKKEKATADLALFIPSPHLGYSDFDHAIPRYAKTMRKKAAQTAENPRSAITALFLILMEERL